MLYDADQQGYPYLKRFTFEPSARKQSFIGDNPKSKLIALSDAPGARFEITFGGADAVRGSIVETASEFIAVKSVRAKGKRLTTYTVGSIVEIEPIEIEEDADEAEETEMADVSDEAEEHVDDATEISSDEMRDEINGQERLF